MPSSGATGVAVGGHNGFSRGKTIFVLAVVVGCFAVLWPRIFYPMFTASLIGDSGDEVCCDVMSEKDTNAYHLMTEICGNILRRDSKLPPPLDSGQPGKKIEISKPAANLCRNEILKQCGVDVLLLLKENAAMTKEYKKSLNQIRSFNTSHCLKISYGVDVVEEIGLARMTKGPFSSPSHMRPERHLRPELMHPALREKGQAIPSPRVPRRTIDREARPGPVPGMRPPMAQAAHVPNTPKGSGTMGIVMPMYTFGIICFFVYTLMKILFKKPADEISPPVKPQPILKDLIDPDHRKYGAYSSSEDAYPNGSERSKKVVDDYKQKEDANRRKASAGAAAGKSDTFKGRLDASRHDGQQEDKIDDELSPVISATPPSPQLVEYAGSLANRILADATSDASSPAQVVTQDVLLTKPGVSDNNVSIPAAGESSRKEDVCSQESHPVVKAVQGILDQVSALGQQASKIETDELTKISQKNEESRSSSKPEKEVDLEQPKGSIKEENKKSEEKAKLEPERKSSVKRHPSAEKEVTFQLPEAKKPEVEDDEEEEEVEEEEEEEEEPVRPPTPPRHGGSKKSKHAIKAEKGLSNARKTPASTSHKEYEDIKKGFKNDEDSDDVDLTTYLTAEADNDGQNNKEDTEGDISVMGKIEELPKDEE